MYFSGPILTDASPGGTGVRTQHQPERQKGYKYLVPSCTRLYYTAAAKRRPAVPALVSASRRASQFIAAVTPYLYFGAKEADSFAGV